MSEQTALVDVDYLVGRMIGSAIAEYSVLAALDDLGVISLRDLLPKLQERLDVLLEEAAAQKALGAVYIQHAPLEELVTVIKVGGKSGDAGAASQKHPVTTGSVPAAGGANDRRVGCDRRQH